MRNLSIGCLCLSLVMTACGSPTEQPRPRAKLQAPVPKDVSVPTPAKPPPSVPVQPQPLAAANSSLPDFTALVRKSSPAVVNIYTKTRVRERQRQINPYFHRAPRERVSESLGTGFIIDKSGIVVTNNHVIDKATEISVRTVDDREFEARVVGTDPRTDIAVLELVDAPPMPELPLGDSDKAQVGQWVLAIGNALGLSSTVTKGIISAKGRSDVPIGGDVRYVDFLQTDASINPGNSGGPLLNLQGEVIGINTAIRKDGQGIGFAIPINMAREIIPKLRTKGKVSRSWLGIYVAPITDEEATAAGLKPGVGARVTRTVQGGPAQKAGLGPGDIILRFDGNEIHDIADLRWKSSLAGIGKEVKVDINRNGKPLTLDLSLTRNPYD